MNHFENEKDTQSTSVDILPESSVDIAAQLKKIQEHLGFLEKKLDMLLANSKNSKPRHFDRDFSKPRQHFRSNDSFSRNSQHSHGGNRGPQHNRHENRHENRQGGDWKGNYQPDAWKGGNTFRQNKKNHSR